MARDFAEEIIAQCDTTNYKLADREVQIVGAGIMGTWLAAELVTLGAQRVTLFAGEFDNTTSHRAGGLFAPFSVRFDPRQQALADKWLIETYDIY